MDKERKDSLIRIVALSAIAFLAIVAITGFKNMTNKAAIRKANTPTVREKMPLFLNSQIPKLTLRMAAIAIHKPSAPVCCTSTHIIQIAAPNIGNAKNSLNLTIHGPGLGNKREIAGT